MIATRSASAGERAGRPSRRLLSLAFASVAGADLTSTGDNSASMAMSVLTGVALLCYAATLYVLRPAGAGKRPDT